MTAALSEAIDADAPTLETLNEAYAALAARFDAVAAAEDEAAACMEWDAVRRWFESWKSLVGLQFRLDTRDADARRDAALLAELEVVARREDANIQRRLLQSPHRSALERRFGSHAYARWQADVESFDPAIQADLVRETQLAQRYTELIGGAQVPFHGAPHSLAQLGAYADAPDRDERRAACVAGWSFFEENAAALDTVYEELVARRTAMAHATGFASFTGLAYRRLGRTDYGPAESARFRAEIRSTIVPLAQAIVRAQADELGVGTVMPWDDQVYDRGGPIASPHGAALLTCARDAFAAMHPRLGALVELLHGQRLADVEQRDGKGAGAFCTFFPVQQLPFVFVNPSGTSRDVISVVHECGHAFQTYSSKDKVPLDYLWPTLEAAEIHSMGLEFLAWPQLDCFVGADAERFRSAHLRMALLSLPYIAMIDEFQERVYAEPEASPAARHATWRDLERLYRPWRDEGAIPHLEGGGAWQRQRHVYAFPFYYIDYALALCCALQFWSQSLRDYDGTLERYIRLCERGGEAPFRELIAGAGLASPFEPGVLADVAANARAFLGLG